VLGAIALAREPLTVPRIARRQRELRQQRERRTPHADKIFWETKQAS
jgi:hypothetical protein